ncbi:MAG TPA: ATP-binding protein [Bacteroidia bacterium]
MTIENFEHANKLTGSAIPGSKENDCVFYQLARYPDGSRKFLYLSYNTPNLLGLDRETAMNYPELLFSNLKPEYLKMMLEKEEQSYSNLEPFDVDVEYQVPNGKNICLNLKSIPFKTNDGVVVWYGIQTDITEIKLQEYRLKKAKHELEILNSINDLIINENPNDIEMLNSCCKCLVDNGYILAWICNGPSLESGLIKPLTASGLTDYLNNITIDLKSPVQYHGPTIMALKSKHLVVTNDINLSEQFKPWLETALSFGIASTIAIPFELNEVQYIFNIYSKNTDAFDQHEIEILKRVVKNIQLALKRNQESRSKKEINDSLKERVKELHTLTSVHDIIQSGSDVDAVLENIVNMVPEGLQFPEQSIVRLTYDSKTYTNKNLEGGIAGICEETKSNNVHLRMEFLFIDRSENEHLIFLDEEHTLLKNVLLAINLFIRHRKTLEELTNSQSNLKTIFESTDEGYALLDIDGSIITYNEVFRKLSLVLSKVEIAVNKKLTDLISPEKHDNFITQFSNSLKEGQPIEYESSYLIDGGKRYYIISIYPVFNHKHGCINMCLTVKDITKKRLQEIERKQIIGDLIIRNRDLEQFSYLVSHNLRAPIVNILGLSNLIANEIKPDETEFVKNSLIKSADQVDQVLRDINEILTFKSARLQVQANIKLNELIHDVINGFKSSDQTRQPEFILHIEKDMHVKGIRTYFETIAHSLIENSIRFSKPNEKPIIEISAANESGFHVLKFKDHGIGIDVKKNKNRLFHIHNRFNKDSNGKGIGLYMVKTQVQLLGGDIDINSQPGEGTEIVIHLPIDND